jgi:hypothetical protein
MEATLASGTLLAGRYRIVCKIGEGGYGAVYKAQDGSGNGMGSDGWPSRSSTWQV